MLFLTASLVLPGETGPRQEREKDPRVQGQQVFAEGSPELGRLQRRAGVPVKFHGGGSTAALSRWRNGSRLYLSGCPSLGDTEPQDPLLSSLGRNTLGCSVVLEPAGMGPVRLQLKPCPGNPPMGSRSCFHSDCLIPDTGAQR